MSQTGWMDQLSYNCRITTNHLTSKLFVLLWFGLVATILITAAVLFWRLLQLRFPSLAKKSILWLRPASFLSNCKLSAVQWLLVGSVLGALPSSDHFTFADNVYGLLVEEEWHRQL